MASNKEDRIRSRAYEIWKREGCPEGRDREHWEEAVQELDRQAGSEADRESNTPTEKAASEPQQQRERPSGSRRSKT